MIKSTVFHKGILPLLLAGSFVLLASCQKKAEDVILEKVIEHSTGSDVELNTGSGRVSIESEGKKFEITQDKATWPDDMPSVVPRFAYGTIMMATRTETPESDGWSVTIEKVSANALREYDALLKKAGFETTLTTVTSAEGSGGTIQATNGAVTVFLMGDNKALSLAVSQEKKQ
ncbi:hypothetical protein [Chlorobium sp.]|uniref:hypothetical protein n=1 Tax=Chlorobium sp. TaxID=1095 RepID=UPI002F401EAD